MKTTIGIFENHDKAMAAVQMLKEDGFPVEKVTVIGIHPHPDAKERKKEEDRITNIGATEVGISAGVGTAVGILSGVGLLAIPGLGVLVGAGALAGAIIGLDLGLVTGGVVGALSIAGMKKKHHEKYDAHLKEGKFMLIVQGKKKEAHRAEELLHEHGTHHELAVH